MPLATLAGLATVLLGGVEDLDDGRSVVGVHRSILAATAICCARSSEAPTKAVA